MFDRVNVGVTTHAIQRFRQRIDPTATAKQIQDYVRQSRPSEQMLQVMRDFGYGVSELLFMYRSVEFHYLHATFIVTRGKGKAVEVVTTYRR